ncbi:MAG TPA: hypothetical protein DEA08_23730, partial [Planctomycetes bacterium]|nr:hypothetical protein [Planctomycetota bacterium]
QEQGGVAPTGAQQEQGGVAPNGQLDRERLAEETAEISETSREMSAEMKAALAAMQQRQDDMSKQLEALRVQNEELQRKLDAALGQQQQGGVQPSGQQSQGGVQPSGQQGQGGVQPAGQPVQIRPDGTAIVPQPDATGGLDRRGDAVTGPAATNSGGLDQRGDVVTGPTGSSPLYSNDRELNLPTVENDTLDNRLVYDPTTGRYRTTSPLDYARGNYPYNYQNGTYPYDNNGIRSYNPNGTSYNPNGTGWNNGTWNNGAFNNGALNNGIADPRNLNALNGLNGLNTDSDRKSKAELMTEYAMALEKRNQLLREKAAQNAAKLKAQQDAILAQVPAEHREYVRQQLNEAAAEGGMVTVDPTTGALSPAVSNENQLKPYTSQTGGFTGYFPGTPAESTSTNNGVSMRTYSLDKGDDRYLVTVATGSTNNKTAEQILDEARDAGVSRAGGRLVSEKKVTVNGAPARDLVVETATRFMIIRLISKDSKLYTVIHSHGKTRQPGASTFVGAFKPN